jgi:hypothetical protein
MAHAPLPVLERRRFGETLRPDTWWLPNVVVVTILTSFIIYATWAAFQNANYTFGPYLSPFYSPEIWGDSPHAWFGPKPAWWPAWLPFSPALIILPIPALFRFTCYYYRGAYYKAFWADPPQCAVGEPRKSYRGEQKFPLILQNFHRYGLLASVVILVILYYDAWLAFRWDVPGGGKEFGVGVGTLVMLANVVLLSGYTFGCHSTRHVVGGLLDQLSRAPVRKFAYDCSTCLNRDHMKWAWASLISVASTDVYIRLCAMGILTDVRII